MTDLVVTCSRCRRCDREIVQQQPGGLWVHVEDRADQPLTHRAEPPRRPAWARLLGRGAR